MVASGTALFEPLVTNASHRSASPVHPKASSLSPGKLTVSSPAGVGKHDTLTTICGIAGNAGYPQESTQHLAEPFLSGLYFLSLPTSLTCAPWATPVSFTH